MQELYLALGVTLTVLAIGSVQSARLRAAIYVLPIPISIILLGTDASVNATHPFSLLLVLAFLTLVWVLYVHVRLPIALAIALAIPAYVTAGLVNQLVVNIPFGFMYVIMIMAWLLWLARSPFRKAVAPVTKASVRLQPKDYLTRGGIVFGITYVLVGIRDLILGAAVTFPYNGIFAAYIVKDSLPYFINEVGRNFAGLINFFGVVYLLQDQTSTFTTYSLGWLACIVTVYCVTKYVPRPR